MERSDQVSMEVKEGSTADQETKGILSINEAVRSLDAVQKFMQKKDAEFMVLQREKLEHKCSGFPEWERQKI